MLGDKQVSDNMWFHCSCKVVIAVLVLLSECHLLLLLCVREYVYTQLNTQMNTVDKNIVSTVAACSSEIPRLYVCGLHTHIELQFWQLDHPSIVTLAEESHRTMGPLSSRK